MALQMTFAFGGPLFVASFGLREASKLTFIQAAQQVSLSPDVRNPGTSQLWKVDEGSLLNVQQSLIWHHMAMVFEGKKPTNATSKET